MNNDKAKIFDIITDEKVKRGLRTWDQSYDHVSTNSLYMAKHVLDNTKANKSI